MQYTINSETKKIQANPRNRDALHFNTLVIIFLLLSLGLIFTVATWGMKRNTQQWWPVKLTSQVAGNYGVDPSAAPKLPPVNPQIIEAVKQDAQAATIPRNVNNLTIRPIPAVESATTAHSPQKRIAVNAGGPYQGFEGSRIHLVIENMNLLYLLPGAVTFYWDLDNDGEYDDAKGVIASVIFYDEGQYRIGVQATSRYGQVVTDTTTVSVSNVAPTIKMANKQSANEAEEVEFSAAVTDPGHDILLYEWDFGDGSRTLFDTLNPKHTYLDNGDYTVRLRVRDNDDGLTEKFMLVHVKNLAPFVNAGPNWVIREGETISFLGTASDPAGDFDPLTYAWDLDYDGLTFTPDVLNPIASKTYPNGPANVAAALRVQDDDGGETIEVVNVTVKNVAPIIASVTNNNPVFEGSPLTLKVKAIDVGSDTLTCDFDWNNDGQFEAMSQTSPISHTWYNQGRYSVGIRVKDNDGGQVLTTTTVTAYNAPPMAQISNPNRAHFEGDSIAFAGNASDPGIFDALTYNWHFGDGHTANTLTTTHIYANNNVYTATLTVTDDSGDNHTASVAVTILNANPTANAGPDRIVDEGVQTTFNGTASDPGPDDLLTFAWDFVYEGTTFDEEATGASAQVTYLDGPATYKVALRVRDDDYPYPTGGGGEMGEYIDTLRVTVRNLPPLVDAFGPYSGIETLPTTLSGTATDVLLDTLSYEWDLDNDGTFETPGQTITPTWNTAGIYAVTLRVTDDDGGVGFDTTQVTIENALPTAEANGPYQTTVNLPVTLSSAGSTDPINDSLTYQWNFGDGTPSIITSSITVTHTYLDDGVYTATLQVNDGRGGTDNDIAPVTVNNLPPTASATATLTTTLEGITVTFNGSGSSDPGLYDVLTYRWNFGDGSPLANGLNVNHAYADNNVYTVTLTVTDDGGMTGADTLTITVLNANPLAQAGPDRIVDEGTPINFNGGGSSDAGTADILAFAWDFYYDGVTFDEEAVGVSAQTIYLDGPATYTVALRVRDDDYPYPTGGGGEIGEHFDTLTVAVQNTPPIVDALGPYTGHETIPLTLSGTATDVAADTLTYEWDLNNDGIFETNGQSVINTWSAAGFYTVTLRVTDEEGGVGFDSAQVTINNAPPTAEANGPYTTTVNLPVSLNATGSTDPTGDPLTYQWNFGDGTPVIVTSSITVSHVYLDDNVYTAVLQIDDGRGGADTDTATVTVNNSPPVAAAVVNPNPALEGASITFDGSSSSDPGIFDTLSYQWNFGDGTPIGNGPTITHTYADDNVYTAILTVTDDGGATDTDIVSITVLNVDPVADAGGPYSTAAGVPVILIGNGSDVPADPLIFSWDLNNDSVFETPGQTVTYTGVTTTGIYTVGLQIDDGDGGISTDTTTIQVGGLLFLAWPGIFYFLFSKQKHYFISRRGSNTPQNNTVEGPDRET
ncbi:MAG: PKD domain-containing protein [Anaerolineae bacterium]|nr:PKD domain-containing protein [Anaerolineae bacterium]